MKAFYLIVLWLFLSSTAFSGEGTLKEKLFLLPDVIFTEVEAYGDFEQVFELKVKQPIDHNDYTKGYFYQRVVLSHIGFDELNVMVTEGYNIWRRGTSELAGFLGANQIDVEHRYFGESCPDSMDYTYLNLEQATADLHHINTLMRKIYSGKWLSTGRSKSGATSIFYRYFYPNDVDVSVPYVAPINREKFESRIYNFLDTIGTDDCRAKILSLQKYLLSSRDEVLPLLEMYVKGARQEFNYLGFEAAFEYMILEYPFAFWQYGKPCDAIPDTTVSVKEALEYMLDVSGTYYFSDKGIDAFLSHYYQSASEMGYYAYRTVEFDGLLEALPMKPYPFAALVPGHIPVEFDQTLLNKVNAWLQNNADKMIYLYGNNDTWTASAVPSSDKVDALWFFMKGKSHGDAEIAGMTVEEKARFVEALERWLQMELE